MSQAENSKEQLQTTSGSFVENIEIAGNEGKFICVGLDSKPSNVPDGKNQSKDRCVKWFLFNCDIVDATCDTACAYKIDWSFYLAEGKEGWDCLAQSIEYIRQKRLPVILDTHSVGVEFANSEMAIALFSQLQADAITVGNFFGFESLAPYLKVKNKGVIVECLTTNQDGVENFQSMVVRHRKYGATALYKVIANEAQLWNANGNVCLMAGATYPIRLAKIRKIAPDMPILIDGIGAQGGNIDKAVGAAKDSRGQGIIVSASRSIIYASRGNDYALAARRETLRLNDVIKRALRC